MEPLEIERKYLIRMPPQEILEKESVRKIAIRQVYLLPGAGGENRRIRQSRTGTETVYYYTEKKKLTSVTRIEREREISPEKFRRFLAEADGERRPIEKTRWCVPFEGHLLEIDVFPFWEDRAFCEAELRAETEEIRFPGWLRVIREVTEDPRYTNSALAREIPADPI